MIIVIIEISNTGTAVASINRKSIRTKNCSPFTDCISEKKFTQIDNVNDIDVVMLMYN